MSYYLTFFLAIAMTCALGTGVAAQTTTITDKELAGTWILQDEFIPKFGKQTWVITSNGNELRIRMSSERESTVSEYVLFTDKRGEINSFSGTRSGITWSVEHQSKTFWDKGYLIRDYRTKAKGDSLPAMGRWKFKVSPDLKTLKLTESGAVGSPPIVRFSNERVFIKVS